MKKLLIASAVSAAFAAPTVALAQAARAPTLSQVLDASGLDVSGYLDAAYSYANRNVETGFTNRVFDSQNNSFALHQFGLRVAKQPSRGFGGVVNITAGSDAQVIHSFPEGVAANTFDLTQAYGQYSTGSLTLMAGKFVTLAGSEVIWSPSNANFSHSILFGAIPFTHTGVRAGYAVSDIVTLYGGINNGWDQLTDANKGKTVELGASIIPTKALTINVTGYLGKERAVAPGTPAVAGAQDTRNLLNVVATYTINNRMSAGGEILYVSQDRAVGGAAKYNGLAGYYTYNLNREWRVAARAEMFDDKNNFHFGPNNQPAGTDVKYNEITATLAYLPSSSVELRGEIRGDRSDKAVFINSDGTTAKSMQSLGFQGIYKF